MIQSKFKLVQIIERYPVQKYSDSKGLHDTSITEDCSKFCPEEFSSVGEAESFRNYKAYPDDYIIIQVF